MNTAEASEDKVVAGYNREFLRELWHRTRTKNLHEISAETGIPFNFLKDVFTRVPVAKKIDKIYNNIPVANRSLQNITEILNRGSDIKHQEKFVARCLKALGYNFVDEKENTNNSYKGVISNNVKEDVSDAEIINYIQQPGKTVMDAAEYFKKYGKSARELREIYANSNEDRKLIYEVASAFDNDGGLPVNGAVESVISVIRSVYGKEIDMITVHKNLKKMDFIPNYDLFK